MSIHPLGRFFYCLLFGFCSMIFLSPIQAQTVSVVTDKDIFTGPPFKACHASSLTELSDGRIFATWFAGEYESHPEVSIWGAFYFDGNWTKPVKLVDGKTEDGKQYACWNPVVFVTQAGRLLLFYKVGPNPREWWGMMIESTDNGKSWSSPRKLPADMLGPIKNKPIQLADGSILHPSSTESLDEKKWLIHLEISDSTATQWKKIEIDCDTFGVIQPTILQYNNNRLQMLSRSRQNAVVECWSADGGKSWSALKKINLLNPNSGIDAVTLKSGWQVLVYNPARTGKDWMYGREELRIAISKDGKTWKDVHTLVKKEKGEFSYPAIIQTANGDLHVTYTWDRENIRHVVVNLKI